MAHATSALGPKLVATEAEVNCGAKYKAVRSATSAKNWEQTLTQSAFAIGRFGIPANLGSRCTWKACKSRT